MAALSPKGLSHLAKMAPGLASILLLSGCGLFGGSSNAGLGEPQPAKPVFGYAVAPDPQAALAARQILLAGGNAADAAAAAGFVLAVTLPSRAGLGGGGGCLINMPNDAAHPTPKPVALLFLPQAPASVMPSFTTQGADRPAAVPEMARGLIAMQVRYGHLPLSTVMAPAETLAGGGAPVSRALASDLQVVGNALIADPAARNVFATPSGALLTKGEILRQPDLAATLGAIQTGGVLNLVQGRLARRFAAAADQAGGGISFAELGKAVPHYAEPLRVSEDGTMLSFLPPPAYGGPGAAAGYQALAADPQDVNAAARRAVAASFAAEKVTAAAPALPASTGFATLDQKGGVIACATTMNNLFGTGRVAPGTGILLAASPAHVPPPLLAAGIAYRGKDFRAAATGSGQSGAPMAVAAGLYNAIHAKMPMPVPVPEPGRANVIACSGLMPGNPKSCAAATDPRGFGLAIGTN
jgi:gamma-glutamyltranspeptidase/glutathione hydrolase